MGRILIAEDNATNRMVLGRILDKWNCKYHLVANGNEAIDALRDSDYDLILMDCQMPDMDGYEATRLIRSSPTLNRDIPIIALTANAVQGDEEKCRAAGMNAYLSKPIDRDALQEVLGRYLKAAPEPQIRALDCAPETASFISLQALKQFDELQKEGMPDILVEVIDSYSKTAPTRLIQLSQHIQVADFVSAAKEAHALKSSALTLGAVQLGKVCQEIESLKDSKNADLLKSLLPGLQKTFESSLSELFLIRERQILKPKKKEIA